MNNEARTLSKVLMFASLFLAPIAAIMGIYVYFRDVKMGRNPQLNDLVKFEILLISVTVFAYWTIKRRGWDFWKK